jgi:hypothetical protein
MDHICIEFDTREEYILDDKLLGNQDHHIANDNVDGTCHVLSLS